jgi:hypothetical protein
MRLAQVNEISVFENHEYRSFTSPENQLGIPVLVEEWSETNLITPEYIKQHIDEVAWLIQAIVNTNETNKFPQACELNNRLKNDNGYYYYDLVGFTNSYSEFYNTNLESLKNELLKRITTAKMIHLHVTDTQEIINYAEQKWKL